MSTPHRHFGDQLGPHFTTPRDGPPGRAVTAWFRRNFVDGCDRVMPPDVLGMSRYADGGRMTTTSYTTGGAHIDRMSDLRGPCAYRPTERTAPRACPCTSGYWACPHRHRERFAHHPRTARAVHNLDRLSGPDEAPRHERSRGDAPP